MSGGIPLPSPSVIVSLASLAVHVDEAMSPNGHELDAQAIKGILGDPFVQEFLERLRPMGLLPEQR
jgi:hypothetical protein